MGTSFERIFRKSWPNSGSSRRRRSSSRTSTPIISWGCLLEQGLIDEAIEEFITAAQDDSKAFECCHSDRRCLSPEERLYGVAEMVRKCRRSRLRVRTSSSPWNSRWPRFSRPWAKNRGRSRLMKNVSAWNADYRDVLHPAQGSGRALNDRHRAGARPANRSPRREPKRRSW